MNAGERSTAAVPGAPRPDGRYDMLDEGIATPPVPATLTLDGNGGATFAGLPVTMSATGEPLVQTSAGLVSIATATSLGVNFEEERLLHASRTRMGAA